jgi:copper chaperone NosL
MFKNVLFINALLLLLISSTFLSCQSKPEPILYGEDECDNCKMTISDPKYGAELITDKGKIFKFDSIECLADYSTKVESGTIGSMWVADFSNPENLINALDALYLKSDRLRSPMGLNLSAFNNSPELEKVINEFGGDRISWTDLIKYVSEKWN